MKIPASCPDDEPDDPRSGARGEGEPRDASSSSPSASMSQSTRDEESSAAGGSAAPGDDSPSASASVDGDRDPERTRELAAANAEDIDSLEETVNWVVKFVVERTDPPGETAAGGGTDTADRGFQ